MATATFNFAPSTAAPYQFSPVLDGQTYNATVPWLLFGARFYLNLVSLAGVQIWYGAVAGSPGSLPLATLSWANGAALASTVAPHGLKVASTVNLNVSGCTPAAYNGLVRCIVTGPSSFSWPLASDPGGATVLGSASQDINMLGGVPNENGVPFSSRLVFRQPSQQFEVW